MVVMALSANQKHEFLKLLWDYMIQDQEFFDRVHTGSGMKTRIGLLACIERIMEEGRP